MLMRLISAVILALAIAGDLASAEYGAIAEARAMLLWHAGHRFCARCGARSERAQAGWKRVCPACATEHFPRTDPVVIMLVEHGDRCLLGRGPQLFSLTGVPADGKTAAQVEAALRAQVARVAKEGVSEAELNRVKTQWVASEVYKRDSVMGQAQELGHTWIQGLPLDTDERLMARLRGVTAAQVQAVAQKYFGDDQMTVATLLPQPRDPNAKARTAPAAGARH